MSRKSFKDVEPVYQDLINTQEAPQVQDELRTQGRTGMKLPRINLAFSPTNYEFIKIMAAMHGQNLTQYVNEIINAERERKKDIFEQTKALRDSL